jgi:hypothetical protein
VRVEDLDVLDRPVEHGRQPLGGDVVDVDRDRERSDGRA